MSKHNKVNPDHYHQAGRLTPDDWARERMKQQADVQEHQPPQRQQDQVSPPQSSEGASGNRE
jgi:hypothetical protein